MRRTVLKRINRYIIGLLFLLILSSVCAAEEPANILADEIVYDKKENIIIGRGAVNLQYREIKLFGDRIEVNTKTGDGIATGDVLVEGRGSKIAGERFLFNIYTEKGIAFNASGFAAPYYYFTGNVIERVAEDRMKIKKGSVTSCLRKCPKDTVPWEFRSRESNLQLEEYAHLQHASFHVLGFPVFYLPYWIASIKTKRATGFLMPVIGSSREDGFFFNNAFFWAFDDSADVTFGLDYLSRRGTRYNAQLRYILGENTKGEFNGSYIKDGEYFNQNIAENTILFDDTLSSGEKTTDGNEFYIIRYDHEHALPYDVRGLLNMHIENEGDSFSKEFFDDNDLRSVRQAENDFTLTKNWETRSLELTAEHIKTLDTTTDNIYGRLPSLTFVNQEEKIKNTPLYFQMEASAVNFFRDQNNDKTDVLRGDIFPQVSLPLTELPWFTITPKVGFRETFYSRQVNNNDQIQRELFVGETTVQGPTFYRIFGGKIGRAVKMKHLIEPSVTYSYISDFDDDQDDDIIVFDSIDSLGPTNNISYGLTNRILAKEQTGRDKFETREILKLSVTNGYDFQQARDPEYPWKRSLSDVAIDLDTKLLKSLEINGDASYNIEGDRFANANSEFILNLKDIGYLRTETRFSQDPLTGIANTKYYTGGIGVDFIRNWEFEYNIRYDDFENQTDENYYRTKYKSQCWALEVSVVDKPEDTQFFFELTLVGIGDIGKGFGLASFERRLKKRGVVRD